MQWPPFVQVAAAGILSKCIANKYRNIVGCANLTHVKENGCKMRETAVGRILWVVPLYKFGQISGMCMYTPLTLSQSKLCEI